jgi:hypothetical protein
MTHTLSRTTIEPAPAAALFKPDRPRAIDRHIDFFGDHGGPARDMCGEALLDALTGASDDDDETSSDEVSSWE